MEVSNYGQNFFIYTHSFCAQKCLYCDFPSFARKDHLRKAYIEALNKEIISLREKHNNLEINTIFIGGEHQVF